MTRVVQKIGIFSWVAFNILVTFSGCVHVLRTEAAVDLRNANELVRRADRFRFPSGTTSSIVTVVDFNATKKVRESEYKVISDGRTRSLVETLTPVRQKGRKLLMVGSDLWYFSPDVRRPTRVSLQQKLTGEVANGDLASTNYAGDYNAEIVGHELLDSIKTIRLKLRAKKKNTTYSALDYWINEETGAPIRADYLSTSGKVIKIGRFEKFGPVLGHSCVVQLRIQDAVSKAQSSQLTYSKYQIEKANPALFSKESMTR